MEEHKDRQKNLPMEVSQLKNNGMARRECRKYVKGGGRGGGGGVGKSDIVDFFP